MIRNVGILEYMDRVKQIRTFPCLQTQEFGHRSYRIYPFNFCTVGINREALVIEKDTSHH